MSVEFKWTKTPNAIVKRVFDDASMSTYAPEVVARFADKYVPMDTGILAQRYVTENYEITYTAPYAKRQFFGEGFNFSKEKHALATARWDLAVEKGSMNLICKELNNYLEKGGK